MMKRITIDIFEGEGNELKDMIDVNSKELCLTYVNTPAMHGLQCNFDGDTKEYLEVQKVLEEMTNLARKLNEIYK